MSAKSFVETSKVLVIEEDSTSRILLKKLISSMGISVSRLFIASTYEQGLRILQQEKPEVVISEYLVGNSKGLKILELHKSIFPDRSGAVFIFISTKNSNAIACMAAAEEVDGYFIKPYSVVDIKHKLSEVFFHKEESSDYLKNIESAKELIAYEEYGKAMRLLKEALNLDTTPATALYYLASINIKLKRLEVAEHLLETGLSLNGMHYRCLRGLFDVYSLQNRFSDAYNIAHRIHDLYPIDPTLIPQLVRICVQTKRYDDLIAYYDIFSESEDQLDPSISNYVVAGLITSGKHFLESGKKDQAINAFHKAESLSGSKDMFMKEIILSLIKAGDKEQAESFLERSSDAVKKSADIHAQQLEAIHLSYPPTRVLKIALNMINSGIKHPKIFEIAIQRALELQKGQAFLDSLLENYKASYPNQHALKVKA